MNQFVPFLNRFVPTAKLQDIPRGSSIICPINSGTRLIMNFVGLELKFDSKLHKILEKVWNKVRQEYFYWSGDIKTFKPGNIKEVLVSSDIMIVHMLVKNKDGIVMADALEKALQNLANFSKVEKASVHISNLLVEEVPALKELAKKYLSESGIHCYFYDTATER